MKLTKGQKAGIERIELISSELNLSDPIEKEAKDLLIRTNEKGKSYDSIAGACCYIACRTFNSYQVLEDFSRVVGSEKKHIGRISRNICRNLNIKLIPRLPEDMVYARCSELELSPKTTSDAVDICIKTRQSGKFDGYNPKTLAASAVYISALIHGEKRTQKEVADAFRMAEPFLRKVYRDILETMDILSDINKAYKQRTKQVIKNAKRN